MSRLNNKVAIVTGGARGIGEAIATQFISQGAKVILTDLLEAEGQQVAARLGENARFFQHDVCDANAWKAVIDFAKSTFGEVNVLVNNAGILGEVKPFDEADEADFRRVLDVNVISIFLGMKLIASSMKKSGGGSIINLSSVTGLVSAPQNAAYTASKFAVRGMTKSAAIDYGSFKIRVNSIHPGFIETPMTAALMPSDTSEVAAFAQQSSLLGRMGKPEDMANMAVFLASDESSFATGSEFVVDGGYIYSGH